MKSLSETPLNELLDRFAAPTPTPGGGSASALAGAVGTALVAKVAGLGRTRIDSPAARAALDHARTQLERGYLHLLEQVDRDSEAYDAVSAAYRMPKETDEDRRARSDAIQDALRGAVEVPLDVMRAARAAAVEALLVAEHGSHAASTDVAVGIELLKAACRGAALNVGINLEGIRDVGYVDGARQEVRSLEAVMAEDAARVLRQLETRTAT
jgi:formiminotetrahydrofolate cyclodeaminase